MTYDPPNGVKRGGKDVSVKNLEVYFSKYRLHHTNNIIGKIIHVKPRT